MRLKSITFVKPANNLPAGLTIPFNVPVTFLVGDNGCGKSSIINALRCYFGIADSSYIKQDFTGVITAETDFTKSEVIFKDFHSENNKFSQTLGASIGLQLQQMKCSSGQGNMLMLDGLSKERNKLIVLDEPCRGLSIKFQMLMRHLLGNLAQNGNQLIVSTHSMEILKLLKPTAADIYSVQKNIFYQTAFHFEDDSKLDFLGVFTSKLK